MTDGAGPYRVLPELDLKEGRFSVRAVGPEHIEAIRTWRNAQIDVLRQAHPISTSEQAAYFARAIWPDKTSTSPRNILMILLQDGEPIGYGGLVHIDWDYRRAEVSFLLDPALAQDHDKGAELWGLWLGMMKKLAFGALNLRRLTTETYLHRTRYIETLEACGFQREGHLREHVLVDGQPTDALIHGCLARDEERG